MTHQQATNILRRDYPRFFWLEAWRGFTRIQAAETIVRINQADPERARTRHIVRGIVKRN